MSERAWLAAAVGFGVLCRVHQYLADASLWHDESFVALNVLDTPATGLLGPLDWHEPSPPGFLVIEQSMVAAFGASELALRALPLLAGIAALLWFARLATRLCRRGGAFWAVLMLAASPKLIADACQVKHFSVDLLIAIALFDLTVSATRDAAPRPALLLAWGVTAALGLWCSYAAAFVAAGCSVALAGALPRWPRSARAAYVAANLCVLASALALAPTVLAQRGDVVVDYWRRAFPDFGSPWAVAGWLGRALVALFDYVWQPLGGVLLVLAVIAAFARRQTRAARGEMLLLWLPVALALAAAALRWWPFGGNQHMSFAAPAVLVLAGDGLEIVRRRIAINRPRLAWAAPALVLAPGLALAAGHLVQPRQRHDLRAAIAFMRAHAAPDDQVAVFDEATFAFYTGRDLRGDSRQLTADRRVWVVTPRSKRGRLDPGVRVVVDRLLRERPRILAAEPAGAAAYCFGAVSGSDRRTTRTTTDEH